MTQEAKINKIVEKAVEGGWDKELAEELVNKLPEVFEYPDSFAREVFINGILLSHSFAKAVFGKKPVDRNLRMNGELCAGFHHHLQAAVISDNLIDYYYDSLP